MKSRFMRFYSACLSLIATVAVMTRPVLAAVPATGDPRGQRIGWIIGILVVSGVVLVGALILTKKKRK